MYSRAHCIDLTYMGGTGPCGPMTIIFGSGIQSQHTSLNIKFVVNRAFHVLQTPVSDLTYMGSTGACGPMAIIFGSVIQRQYTSLNIKFGVIRTFHVLKTPVYRFDIYGRNRTMWTNEDKIWQCYLESVQKPKYQNTCDSDVPCAQDPSLPI